MTTSLPYYCGAAALKEKVVSPLREKKTASPVLRYPKTLLAIANNEARSRQADDLYTAAAAQFAETAPAAFLNEVSPK